MRNVSPERVDDLIRQLDTAPYPNNDSRDIVKMLRELAHLRKRVEDADALALAVHEGYTTPDGRWHFDVPDSQRLTSALNNYRAGAK